MEHNVVPILAFMAGMTSFFGLFLYLKRIIYKKRGVEVEGEVVDLVTKINNGNKRIFPVVRFLTDENEEIHTEYDFGTYPSLFRKNERVRVVYSLSDHSKFILISARSLLLERGCLIAGAILTVAILIIS